MGDVEPRLSKRTRVFLLVGINLVAFALIAAAAAWITHQEDPPGLEGLPGSRRAKVRQADAHLHHSLRPSTWQIEEWGKARYPLITNSLGFRDGALRKIPARSDRRRVLLLGDSFAEGTGMAWEKSFAGLAAAALEKQDIELLNGGVMSYSPLGYLKLTERLLTEEPPRVMFDEVWVFLDISDCQDEAWIYGETVEGDIVRHEARRKEYGHLLEATLLDVAEPKEESKSYAINRIRSSWTVRPDLWNQYGEDGVILMTLRMNGLADLLHKRGIKLGVAVYPWPDQVRYHDVKSLQLRIWRDWSRDRGAQFLDLFGLFLDDADPAQWRETIRANYIEGDVHWNEMGHRKVADAWVAAILGTPPSADAGTFEGGLDAGEAREGRPGRDR